MAADPSAGELYTSIQSLSILYTILLHVGSVCSESGEAFGGLACFVDSLLPAHPSPPHALGEEQRGVCSQEDTARHNYRHGEGVEPEDRRVSPPARRADNDARGGPGRFRGA